MKKYSKLNEIRLSDIEPKGWLHETLKCERDGMPGHLHEIGYPYDTRCWKYKSLADGGYAAWWPYEQTAYRIDSIARMSALLDNLESYDSILGEEMKECLDNEDTFIGPEELKKAESRNRWPHAVLFRAFYALWSKTGNEFYLEKMRQHYLNDNNDYSDSRDVVNVETMLKLYEYFGDERLLNKAKTAFENYNKRPESKETIKDFVADTYIHDHGVTFNEIAKLSTIMYTYTGEKKYLDAAEAAYKRVDDFHMLPDGIHSCSEALCGKETWRTHESCDISDYTWSIGYLLEATGQAEYADKIENAVFNAFFGATAKDFKAIQYLSTVNQVICARNSTHIKAWFDTPRMAYAPHHYPECCVGNIGRAFPNYILRMYQKTENGMALSLYGDSKYEDEEIRIVQSGNYPYRMSIKLDITVKNNEEKVLKLRVPKWSGGTEISVNGQKCDFDVINGYAEIKVEKDCTANVEFKPVFKSHMSVDNGIYFTYGPFLLALKIDEDCKIDEKEKRQTKDFPAYNIYPASDWSYAVSGWEEPEITIHEVSDKPIWSYVPFEIKIKAKELKNWELVRVEREKKELVNGEGIDDKQVECGASIVDEDNLLMPKLPSAEFVEKNLGEEKEITLIPYGCTNIRLTVFPKYFIYE